MSFFIMPSQGKNPAGGGSSRSRGKCNIPLTQRRGYLLLCVFFCLSSCCTCRVRRFCLRVSVGSPVLKNAPPDTPASAPSPKRSGQRGPPPSSQDPHPPLHARRRGIPPPIPLIRASFPVDYRRERSRKNKTGKGEAPLTKRRGTPTPRPVFPGLWRGTPFSLRMRGDSPRCSSAATDISRGALRRTRVGSPTVQYMQGGRLIVQ
jgi:hypothetical protein